jgi:hypothetical protein
MSDPRATDPLRRPYVRGAIARAGAAAPDWMGPSRRGVWTTLWTWLAAIASAAVILGLVFGYSRSGLVHDLPGGQATTGAAPTTAPANDARAPASTDDDP